MTRSPDDPITRAAQIRPTKVVYDDECVFCVAQAKRLERFARGKVTIVARSREGEWLPAGFDPSRAARELLLVAPDGGIVGGAAAVAGVLRTRGGVFALVARAYDLPGVHAAADTIYRLIARNRYRLFGKTSCEACRIRTDGGSQR